MKRFFLCWFVVSFLSDSGRQLLAQTLKADYQFNNTRSSSVAGAPDLTDLGPGLNGFVTDNVRGTTQQVLHFPLGNGLRLAPTTGVIPNTAYTIAMLFKIDAGGYRRLVDFKNGMGDPGLYIDNFDLLEFFISGNTSPSGTTEIAPNSYILVVMTRDSMGTVTVYLNGVAEFQFSDASTQLAVIDSNNILRFFRDNESGGVVTEHAAGSVARIRLYDGALTAAQVADLDRVLVTTVDDHNDGVCNALDCTLREAITVANIGGLRNITFAPGVTGTIQLAGVLPSLSSSMTIQGPGANLLTVRRNTGGSYRIFTVPSGTNITLSGLTINNGQAVGADGGAILNNGNLTLNDCAVDGNTSIASGSVGGNGGGIYNSTGATLTLSRSTLANNSASQFGGAIYNDAIFSATNCTFASNSAFRGGAVISRFANGFSNSLLRNCTIASCSASSTGGGNGDGGGGFYAEGGAQQVHVGNTIIAGNSNNINPDVRGSYTSEGNNLIGNIGNAVGFSDGVIGDQVGTNDFPIDPQLDLLGNNGGPAETFALLSTSTAINAGYDPLAPLSDQRRYARAGVSDIGAFEFDGLPPVPTVLSAVSRKTHGGAGTFDIALPLTGSVGVECRNPGAGGTHEVIVTFANPVSVDSVTVTSLDGLATATQSVNGAGVTIELAAVANTQTLGITLAGVNDGAAIGDVFIPMGVLVGDTTGNGSVTTSDIGQTKARSGQTVDGSNFRSDVTVNGGAINTSDIGLVKSHSGSVLP